MEGKYEVSVCEVHPFCLSAGKKTEIEIRFSQNFERKAPCQVYLIHDDMPPQEFTLQIEDTSASWKLPMLRPGVLNVVTAVESDMDHSLVSTVTPVPVLPSEAAEEMQKIFDQTMHRELRSDKMLSPDRTLCDELKSAMRKEIWHNHIRSFAVDLDFLLSDMDDEGEDDCQSDERMDEALLNVFRSLLQFLKKSKATATIEYLIMACKERGVISFYSKYTAEAGHQDTSALYETAPRFLNDAIGDVEHIEADVNNDPETAEFLQNFRDGMSGQEAESSCMGQLMSFDTFEAFAQAGSQMSQIEADPPGDHSALTGPSSADLERPEATLSGVNSVSSVNVAPQTKLSWIGIPIVMIVPALLLLLLPRTFDPWKCGAIMFVFYLTFLHRPTCITFQFRMPFAVVFVLSLFGCQKFL